ncbi:HAMP domain-containing histidine kinase [Arenibacter sp. BSSL-BM3]|uniref:histidine kinase n=1 Tax=Arenibacter arenosicollis TaxID=2762274 RepID=A0ABR7QNS1_9FLAO|nr:HAMP domain-containing sensor histidine kinase [Arenibacter arenosicollis]MBC8768845.1 HAMP domain-containing histidine kinase [Arenibacter arenosicollis]
MISAEEKLKERIKELTCLYEVTSIIVNCDYDQIEDALKGILYCLQKAWRFSDVAQVKLFTDQYNIATADYPVDAVFLEANVQVFNKKVGEIHVAYPKPEYKLTDFLQEEKKLLKNVCLEVGNLLERKQIKDNEIIIKRQMERADRLGILGEITAGIAHELNTPLANILGFAELLKTRIAEDTQANKDLDKIINSAIFSREVVKKLMFFACEMPQQMTLVNINPIIVNAINLMEPSLNKKKIVHELNFNAPSIFLRVDTIQLTQVIFNLILNAIYFSPVKGKILIDVKETDDKVEIRISDEGPGIDPKISDKIFEPFYSTKPVGEGSGLGLSVVHGIVKSHKGVISYRSNKPKGTIFTIAFPKI